MSFLQFLAYYLIVDAILSLIVLGILYIFRVRIVNIIQMVFNCLMNSYEDISYDENECRCCGKYPCEECDYDEDCEEESENYDVEDEDGLKPTFKENLKKIFKLGK